MRDVGKNSPGGKVVDSVRVAVSVGVGVAVTVGKAGVLLMGIIGAIEVAVSMGVAV